MIRSSNQELGEYDLIRQPDHIQAVWSVIDASLPDYWDRFFARLVPSAAAPNLTTESMGPDHEIPDFASAALENLFERAVGDYEDEAQKYRPFFDSAALDEYHDDPNTFKQVLSRDIPIIANTLRSRRTELREWQISFRMARAKDLLGVFESVLDFIDEWGKSHHVDQYQQYAIESEPSRFDLDALDDDETMFIPGVIGMGIKSMVLFRLDPERLPLRGRNGLYGLYFLSKMQDFGLPSNSSEFIMVNDVNPMSDGSMIMDQNYWYPYGLFSLYSLRVYDWLETRCRKAGVTLDVRRRFVYTEWFFDTVCHEHRDYLKTMRAHERFEIPW